MSRLNNGQYNEFIPIGDENNPSSRINEGNSSRIESPQVNDTTNDTNTRLEDDPVWIRHEKGKVSLEDFVRLEAICRLLESFVCCKFLCIPSIKRSFQDSIEDHISRFNSGELFNEKSSPNNSSLIIRNWRITVVNDLEETLRDIQDKHRQRVRPESIQQANQEIANFQQRLSTSFESLEQITTNLFDQNHKNYPNQQIRDSCIKIVEGEHSRAKQWLESFSEYPDIRKRANLLCKNAEHPSKLRRETSDKPGVQLTTEVFDNYPRRIILLTFSLKNLFLQEFLLLAFKFFHEYVSHISACIVDGNGQKIQDIDSYTKVPTVFKEGWLIHTIEDFFVSQSNRLLQLPENQDYEFSSLNHLDQNITSEIRNYTERLRNCKSKFYVAEFDKGYSLAYDFLRILQRNIFDDTQEEVRLLYYRLSFDLIRRCPDTDFSQQKFVDCIDHYLKCDESYLLKVVRESLTKDDLQEYICIENFWSKIRDAPFEINFPER